MEVGSFIVSVILSQRLRKYAKSNAHSKLERIFITAFYFSVFLFIVSIFLKADNIASWVWNVFIVAMIVFALKQNEFKLLRLSIFAFVPFIIISVINDLTLLLNKQLYLEWKKYFEFAVGFAYMWMGVIIFTQNKQLKTAEKDRIKRQHEDELNRAIAIRKVELEGLVAERTAELTIQKTELENTLTELRSMQSQLIQSEKMASLGELTAGIAHEIQNPLNFVNNFSEVSNELIDEMKAEMAKGNYDDANEIANDVKQNLDKINHHGKRADSIVKGMLQHSRSSSGVKEPTDINALCDEYLRLSYHGLRAKDKSFNATIKTDFDKSVGKINILPQDIGRVILNLLTNAFYAVNEKKMMNIEIGDVYEPTVSVSTSCSPLIGRGAGGEVTIRVSDNGNGIPKKVLDKIFQPFFTTKPTGQGTGLGLSLSYDIITKAHGGKLKVETKEKEGSTFIIQIPMT